MNLAYPSPLCGPGDQLPPALQIGDDPGQDIRCFPKLIIPANWKNVPQHTITCYEVSDADCLTFTLHATSLEFKPALFPVEGALVHPHSTNDT